MKVIVYMAVSADGFVARKGDSTDFVSKNEWKHFSAAAWKAGNIVIGRRTYEVMRAGGEFTRLGVRRIVVVTRKGRQGTEGMIAFVSTPHGALRMLRKEGFSKALVSGGGELNGSFLRAGLVDEVVLDVMPAVLGSGVKLFGERGARAKLRLVGTKKLAPGEMQLWYRVR